jgi:hypothetical protein
MAGFDKMTAVANDKFAGTVHRLTTMRRWFQVLATTSRTPADAHAIADVLATIRSQAYQGAAR